MSSSITGSLVNESQLLVHIAENGHSFELECDENALVEAVMRSIESVTGINFNDQLVLCSDLKLEPQRPLSAYKLPSNEKEVFIFNKARLQSNAPPPPPEQVEIPDNLEPPSPSSQDPHPLDDALDPALKALPSYERQFRHHYHRGHAIYTGTSMKFEHCERLLREQMVQERAVEVARCNLDQYYRIINQNYGDFMKRYMQQHRMHTDLLANFGKDVEKLRSIKLHPALQTANRKCLLDLVKEENLRKSVENCTSSHKQFENKMSQFKQTFGDVKRRVEDLLTAGPFLATKNLEQAIKEHHRYINEQKSIMQSLSKDVNTVKKLVDDCLSSQLSSSSLRPHDAVSALGPMYDVHDKNHLPTMQACDRAISKLLDFCKEKKNEMNRFVHDYMQSITYVSYLIKDQKLQFPVFKEAMVRQDGLFGDLKLFHSIGPSYRACLAEIVRRKASMKLYMGVAGQLAERLATKRELEVSRREEFMRVHGSCIPRDVLSSMGLFDSPNQCDVNIAPFDDGLLNIDISDVDRYAPEYIAGVTSKLEKHGSFKGTSSSISDSSHVAEAVDISTNSIEKYDSEDILDVSGLIEIAGTCKMEVENAKLKAELAARIALICSLCPQIEYESLDDERVGSILKNATEKTAEALHLKDEYIKHVHSMLKMKQMQYKSYEKRIQELEQKLSDQYVQGQKMSSVNDAADFPLLAGKTDNRKSEFVSGEANMPLVSTSEPMDEVSCISSSFDAKLGLFTERAGKSFDGLDENMLDSSGMQNPHLDSSMVEPHRDEVQISDKDKKDKMIGQLGLSLTNSSTAESMPVSRDLVPCDPAVCPDLDSKVNNDKFLELQSALADKSNQLNETDTKLKAVMEEVDVLKRELEANRKLLDESQMNCAHLENCLHEAREEAQTQKSSADRRASEYSLLRASVIKMRSFFERLKTCVYSPGGVADFADSLRNLAQSLANAANDRDDDDIVEFRKCIRVLADKVGFLSRHREELHDKYTRMDAANEQLRKELEEKRDQVKTYYNKHQLEKQANKEKISFGSLEVHELAAFVLTPSGNYEAITKNSSNYYYLSAESVALFTDHLPSRPNYIVGQIVHIEHQIVKAPPEHGRATIPDKGTTDWLTLNSGSTPNPYGLPVGCEYFVVTVAMLPDTSIRSSSPTS